LSIKTRIDEDIKVALKSGEKAVVGVLRLLKADMKNREIEARRELEDDELTGVISSSVKRRRESIRLFEQGGRKGLADKESGEIEILLKYLPKQMSEEEIREAVKSVIARLGSPTIKQMGQVMKTVMVDIGQRADGRLVSKVVKELLPA